MQCKQIHVHGAKPPKLVDKILSAETEINTPILKPEVEQVTILMLILSPR